MEMWIRKLYHSIFLKDENGKDYRLNFSVVDVVRFVDFGYVYDYYENAIKFFNVNQNSKNFGKDAFGRLILPSKEEFLQQNFAIMDAAIHKNFLDTVVYLVANKDYSAIVSEFAIKKTYLTNDKLEKMRYDFKKTILRKIR